MDPSKNLGVEDNSFPSGRRHLDLLAPSTDNLHHNPTPPTPPYRRDASQSQEVIGRAMPPDYRSEYNASRERVGDDDDDKDDYPREKADHQHRRTDSPERDHLYHHDSEDDEEGKGGATGPSRRIHYPDTDGKGALHTLSSPARRDFPSGSGENIGRHSRASSIAGSEAEEDDEEIYDWSDEEDLVDQEAKYHKKMGMKTKSKGFSVGKFIRFFFSTLIGSIITSAALVAVPILLRILWLNKDKEHRQYIFENVSAWFYWAAANVLISWWIASLIDVVPHVSLFLVDILWGNVSEVMKSRVEQYQIGKGWIKPIFYAAEAWASWAIIFNGIFDLYEPSNESLSWARYTPRVYQVIRFLFFFVLVVCIEKILIQMIAYSFHQTAYSERLDNVNNAIKVLDHLKDYRPKRKPASGASTPVFGLKRGFGFGGGSGAVTPGSTVGDGEYFKSGSRTPADVEEGWLADSDEKFDHSSKGKNKERKKSGNGWFSHAKADSKEEGSSRGHSGDEAVETKYPGSRPSSAMHAYPPPSPPLVNKKKDGQDGTESPGVVLTAARALKAVVLHDARNIRSAEKGGEEEEGEEGTTGGMMGMNSAHEAKKVARDLYYAFRADRKRTYLIPSDFYPAYSTPDEAKEAFRVFDKDDNGDITRAEIKTAIVKVYKERRFLARSLRDVSAAVTTLDRIMLVAAMIFLFFISLSVFGVSIGSSLSSIYTIFIAASFIFKSAAASAFDAIMFLFVTHPFDTGDRCFIDNENLVVRKMGLFATTFTRADGSQTYYFNSMLFTKFINNARRSGNMFESCEMQIHWKTPLSKLDALEKLLNDWIQNDEKRWYVPGVSYVLQKIEFQRNLEVTIGIGHNGTWQDWGMRLARKTAFHAAVQYYANQLGITWSESPQSVLITENNREPFLAEDEMDIILEPLSPVDASGDILRSPTTTAAGNGLNRQASAAQQSHAMMGFMPPAGKSGLRMRKSKHKKGLVANMD